MNYCGGALIAPKVVLSCAHCAAEDVYYEGKRFIVNGYKPGVAGGDNSRSTWRTVADSIPHPDYVDGENDIALYLLTEPVHGLPVYLSLNENPTWPPDGTPLTVLGMGDVDGRLTDADFLTDVVIPVVNIDECQARYKAIADRTIDPDKHICAGAEGYGSCLGDSGSALMHIQDNSHHVHVGIVSTGDASCKKQSEFDNVFTRTSGYIDWIKKVVCDEWEEEAAFCL